MKNLLLGLFLILPSLGFAQELNTYNLEKVEKEIVEMTKVMKLSHRQKKKMLKVRIDKAIDAKRIIGMSDEGTFERKMAWKTHDEIFEKKSESIVSNSQWSEWIVYTCKKCHKASSEKEIEPIKEEENNQEIQLSTSALERVDETVAEMVREMSLYPDQELLIRNFKIQQAIELEKIYNTTPKGPERNTAVRKVLVESIETLKEITSLEQTDLWKAYCQAKKEKETEPHISKSNMEKVEKIVSEMTEVMQLTSEQREMVYTIKVSYFLDSKWIYKSTAKGNERALAFKELNKASHNQIRLATSAEQMKVWWTHVRSKNNN